VEALNYLGKHHKLVVLFNVDRASFATTNASSLQEFQFDLFITAGDIGSYKPDLRNFENMLDSVKLAFDIDADQVLLTAQSQFHDHLPRERTVGLKSAWIERPGTIIGSVSDNIFDWRFISWEIWQTSYEDVAEKLWTREARLSPRAQGSGRLVAH